MSRLPIKFMMTLISRTDAARTLNSRQILPQILRFLILSLQLLFGHTARLCF